MGELILVNVTLTISAIGAVFGTGLFISAITFWRS